MLLIFRTFIYHLVYFVRLFVCKILYFTSIISHILVFVNLYSLDFLASLRQNYISVVWTFLWEIPKVWVSKKYNVIFCINALYSFGKNITAARKLIQNSNYFSAFYNYVLYICLILYILINNWFKAFEFLNSFISSNTL